MNIRVVSECEVYRLLPMKECIELMTGALTTTSQGDVVLPLRTLVWLPDRSGLLGMMPAYLSTPESFGLKVVTVMPRNHGTELDTHQGVVLIFDPKTGSPLAVIDASSITAIRTAAVSAVATRALARESAGDLAVLGSGVQARSHLEAMSLVRSLKRVRVWSRNSDNAEKFAERYSSIAGVAIEVSETAQEAVQNADLICTTTASEKPVLEGAWLSPGSHINAVGACLPKFRELDTEAVVRSRLFTDRRESAINEAGDFLIPLREGSIQEGHLLGEVGDVLLGRIPGRISDEDVTLFESLGIASEDLASAHHIYEQSMATGIGAELAISGAGNGSS